MYESIRHLLFKLNPETAHDWTIGALRPLRAPSKLPSHDPALKSQVAGIEFPSPVGLAAGFDKDAKAAGRMLRLGFGYVELGTVTPRPQPGNKAPRIFRLVDDRAVINRFGFNSDGHDAVVRRLMRRRGKPGIVGVNVGANKNSENRIEDYVLGVQRFGCLADYLTVNVSSPNTPGLRDLQSADQLPRLIERVVKAKMASSGPPIFLKVSPDLTDHEIISVAGAALNGGIDGLIIGNTTIRRPSTLRSKDANEEGGLSGRPLREIALTALKAFRSEIGTKLPLVGVGGIESAEDAYLRIRAGASLVQLYTALIYRGPALVKELNDGLAILLNKDGFRSISQAIGADETPRSRLLKHAPAKHDAFRRAENVV